MVRNKSIDSVCRIRGSALFGSLRRRGGSIIPVTVRYDRCGHDPRILA